MTEGIVASYLPSPKFYSPTKRQVSKDEVAYLPILDLKSCIIFGFQVLPIGAVRNALSEGRKSVFSSPRDLKELISHIGRNVEVPKKTFLVPTEMKCLGSSLVNFLVSADCPILPYQLILAICDPESESPRGGTIDRLKRLGVQFALPIRAWSDIYYLCHHSPHFARLTWAGKQAESGTLSQLRETLSKIGFRIGAGVIEESLDTPAESQIASKEGVNLGVGCLVEHKPRVTTEICRAWLQ